MDIKPNSQSKLKGFFLVSTVQMPLKCHRMAYYAVRGLTLENYSPDTSYYFCVAHRESISTTLTFILNKMTGSKVRRVPSPKILLILSLLDHYKIKQCNNNNTENIHGDGELPPNDS